MAACACPPLCFFRRYIVSAFPVPGRVPGRERTGSVQGARQGAGRERAGCPAGSVQGARQGAYRVPGRVRGKAGFCAKSAGLGCPVPLPDKLNFTEFQSLSKKGEKSSGQSETTGPIWEPSAAGILAKAVQASPPTSGSKSGDWALAETSRNRAAPQGRLDGLSTPDSEYPSSVRTGRRSTLALSWKHATRKKRRSTSDFLARSGNRERQDCPKCSGRHTSVNP